MTAIEMKALALQAISSVDDNDIALLNKINKAINKVLDKQKHRTITAADLTIDPCVRELTRGIKVPDNIDYKHDIYEYLEEKHR